MCYHIKMRFFPSVCSLSTNNQELHPSYIEYLCVANMGMVSAGCAHVGAPSPVPMTGISNQSRSAGCSK